MDRRKFMSAAVFGGLTAGSTALLGGAATTREQPVPVTSPRATSGDSLEPDWTERLTITVGPQKGDLVGSNEKVIQAAVDLIARWGGGTVKILPGTYRFRNSVYLQSNVRILGSGLDTVIFKEPMLAGKLSENSDWYDQEITFADSNGFQVGDGICLQVKNTDNGSKIIIKRTLVARNGNRFKLDRALRENVWLAGEPRVLTLFPLFSGENVANVVFEKIALDGNKANNENLNGNYAGCIWMQDCNRLTMCKVTARNYNGDGMSWQICHDVLVEDCHSHDHIGHGLHPGSGAQRTIMRGNHLVNCDQGIFFCWGVRWGLAEKNLVEDCRLIGISIGHDDTDNIVRENDVRRSGETGILFRDEKTAEFQGNRNLIEKNRVTDVVKEDGVGIDVRGKTKNITIVGNDVRETSGSGKRIGIRLGAETEQIALAENHIEGFAEAVVDLRKK